MKSTLLDEPNELLELSEEELNECLLQEKYNKALLRELVRRSLKTAKEYKKAFEYEKYQRDDTEELLRKYDGLN